MTVALAALFGLVIGSFLNVVAYRIPAGRSVVRPGSACPTCGIAIGAFDNLPVVSWFALRGRCRHCSARISIRYPVVEAGTAAMFAATVAVVGVEWVLPAYLWFVSVTIALSIIDFDTKRLPNRVMYPGTAVALVLLAAGAALAGDLDGLMRAILGGLAYFGALFALALAARGGFGFGDVKLAFLLGLFTAYVSWGVVLVAGLSAFFIGGVGAVVLLAMRRADRKDTIPFGPSMVLGAWLAIAVGERFIDWYIG